MDEIKLAFFKLVADNLLIILIAVGGFLLHLFEFYMGKTKHRSLIEFLLSLVKNESKT